MTARAGSVSPSANRGRLRSLAPIAIFDVVGPLAAFYGLCAAGVSSLGALIATASSSGSQTTT
jgi:hypothetical protein